MNSPDLASNENTAHCRSILPNYCLPLRCRTPITVFVSIWKRIVEVVIKSPYNVLVRFIKTLSVIQSGTSAPEASFACISTIKVDLKI
jgi:hypothetical protein